VPVEKTKLENKNINDFGIYLEKAVDEVKLNVLCRYVRMKD
jgi:hypothetical protein